MEPARKDLEKCWFHLGGYPTKICGAVAIQKARQKRFRLVGDYELCFDSKCQCDCCRQRRSQVLEKYRNCRSRRSESVIGQVAEAPDPPTQMVHESCEQPDQGVPSKVRCNVIEDVEDADCNFHWEVPPAATVGAEVVIATTTGTVIASKESSSLKRRKRRLKLRSYQKTSSL